MANNARSRGQRWGIADNAKFRALANAGKIQPKRQDKQYIEQVRQKHWKDRKFATFRANWKAKTTEWEAQQAIQRASQAKSKCLFVFIIFIYLNNEKFL